MISKETSNWITDNMLHAYSRTITGTLLLACIEYKERLEVTTVGISRGNATRVPRIRYGECPRKPPAGCRLLPAEQFVVVSVLGAVRHRPALLLGVSSRGRGSRDNLGYILVPVFVPRPMGAQKTRAIR
jgi:hypothetical protein